MKKTLMAVLLPVLVISISACGAESEEMTETRLRAERSKALQQLREKEQQERARKAATAKRLMAEKEKRDQESADKEINEKNSAESAAAGVKWNYKIKNGGVTILSVSPAVGSIEVPSTIEGCPVTMIESDAFKDCDKLIAVKIPEGVQAVLSGAFSGCTSLQRVTLPPGLEMICGELFKGCRSLTFVKVPKSVKMVGPWAFDGCVSLKKLTLPTSAKILSMGNDMLSNVEIVRSDEEDEGGCDAEECTQPFKSAPVREEGFVDCKQKYSSSAYLKLLLDARSKSEFKEKYAGMRVGVSADSRVKIKLEVHGNTSVDDDVLKADLNFWDEKNADLGKIEIETTDQKQMRKLRLLNHGTEVNAVTGIVKPPSDAMFGRDEVTLTDVRVIVNTDDDNGSICDKVRPGMSPEQLLKLTSEIGISGLTGPQYQEIGRKLKGQDMSFRNWMPMPLPRFEKVSGVPYYEYQLREDNLLVRAKFLGLFWNREFTEDEKVSFDGIVVGSDDVSLLLGDAIPGVISEDCDDYSIFSVQVNRRVCLLQMMDIANRMRTYQKEYGTWPDSVHAVKARELFKNPTALLSSDPLNGNGCPSWETYVITNNCITCPKHGSFTLHPDGGVSISGMKNPDFSAERFKEYMTGLRQSIDEVVQKDKDLRNKKDRRMVSRAVSEFSKRFKLEDAVLVHLPSDRKTEKEWNAFGIKPFVATRGKVSILEGVFGHQFGEKVESEERNDEESVVRIENLDVYFKDFDRVVLFGTPMLSSLYQIRAVGARPSFDVHTFEKSVEYMSDIFGEPLSKDGDRSVAKWSVRGSEISTNTMDYVDIVLRFVEEKKILMLDFNQRDLTMKASIEKMLCPDRTFGILPASRKGKAPARILGVMGYRFGCDVSDYEHDTTDDAIIAAFGASGSAAKASLKGYERIMLFGSKSTGKCFMIRICFDFSSESEARANVRKLRGKLKDALGMDMSYDEDGDCQGKVSNVGVTLSREGTIVLLDFVDIFRWKMR